VAIMAVFGAFNAVVSHHELVQAAPRAFHEVGLIVVVALAFVPSTIESVRAVREADRARTGGRAVRRGRLVRQVVPVLERGLEKALALAESMDSRARGRAAGGRRRAAACAGWAGWPPRWRARRPVRGGPDRRGLLGVRESWRWAPPSPWRRAPAGSLGTAEAPGAPRRGRDGAEPRRARRLALLAASGQRSLTWSGVPPPGAFSPLVALALLPLLSPLLPGEDG